MRSNEAQHPDKENITPEQEDVLPESAAQEKPEEERLADKYNELNDRYLRLMAEYDNYRKRTAKERDDIYPSAMANTVSKFLPVLDSFERAEQFDRGTEEFSKGFDMISQNFKDVLAAMNVQEIGKVGEAFDPLAHNAVMHVEDETLGENVVSQVLQKGYKIGDKIIRYAMVQTAN